MTVVQEWMFRAAQDIVESLRINPDSIPIIHNFIRARSPFKQDTVYMEVPRCENCVHWMKKPDLQLGLCGKTIYDDIEGWVEHSKSRATAVVNEDDLSSASLETDADFGCVQFVKAVPVVKET